MVNGGQCCTRSYMEILLGYIVEASTPMTSSPTLKKSSFLDFIVIGCRDCWLTANTILMTWRHLNQNFPIVACAISDKDGNLYKLARNLNECLYNHVLTSASFDIIQEPTLFNSSPLFTYKIRSHAIPNSHLLSPTSTLCCFRNPYWGEAPRYVHYSKYLAFSNTPWQGAHSSRPRPTSAQVDVPELLMARLPLAPWISVNPSEPFSAVFSASRPPRSQLIPLDALVSIHPSSLEELVL